jgi:hypothetical protein
MGLDNQQWQVELRKNVIGLKNCRFPKSSEIELGGTIEQATITMKEKGLHANMQSDAAAFEAWALALLCHCGAQSVQISLDTGAAKEGLHYERFLYRLKRFTELFPNCVTSTFVPKPKALGQGRHIWNQSNSRSESPDANSTERMLAASRKNPKESDLELALEISSAFKSHFRLDKVMRQWPVGLFDECVADGNQLFTGGKSGIDLVGIRGDTLVLFELKKAGNEKVGAVSELLFYASVMRDSIGASAIFKFESQEARKNCAIGPEDIIRCSRICAVLLAPRFHPLITEPRMFEELNRVMKKLYSDRPIQFETAAIIGPQNECGDFVFGDGKSIE